MKFTVQITEEDIQQGKQHNCTHCPTALAINRATKDVRGFIHTEVGLGNCWFEHPSGEGTAPMNLGDVVLSWITNYDKKPELQTRTPAPVEFELDIPQSVMNKLRIHGPIPWPHQAP